MYKINLESNIHDNNRDEHHFSIDQIWKRKKKYEEILIEKLAEQIRYPLPTYLAYVASHN